MTGHQELFAIRRAGHKPEFVWVSDFENCYLDGFTVRVAGDTPELEDFRFLVGVTAIVEGSDAARVDRIAKTCQAIARRVIASTFNGRDVVRVTDTEGVMSWPV
jgi:hypothetical protein